MKKVVFSVCLLFVMKVISAQNLKFLETTHEFYHIQEIGGKVSCQFLYTNVSDSDIIIQMVSSDACSCLSFNWDKKPIAPNDKGNISVTLNPKNRKGMFAFPLNVLTVEKGVTHIYQLTVKGYIVPKPTTKEEEYPMMEGHLRYKTNQKRYVMHREQSIVDTMFFYNVWDSMMTFTMGYLPPSIKIIYLTSSLKPKGEGILVFTFDAKIKNDWGNVWDKFIMQTNDPERPHKTFYLTAEIYENFENWTPEQRANAPHIYTENNVFDFGTDTSGKNIQCTFAIKNTGKSKLIIYKVKTSCGCTTPKLIKTELEPNEILPVEALFRTSGKTGSQFRTIDIITNDPDQPKLILQIKGVLMDVPKK